VAHWTRTRLPSRVTSRHEHPERLELRRSSIEHVSQRIVVLSAPKHKSHPCYYCYMTREITQRELRNDSGEIMRALDQGEPFLVTRNGTPVGELIPLRRRRFVSAEVVMGAFARAPRIDPAKFRADVDSVLDQDPTPRA
jgi:prevent-host-death family protein